MRLLALLSRLLARRCARGDEHAAAACAWRPKLLHAAWPGLRPFAQEVRWDWASPSYYICLQPLLHMHMHMHMHMHKHMHMHMHTHMHTHMRHVTCGWLQVMGLDDPFLNATRRRR